MFTQGVYVLCSNREIWVATPGYIFCLYGMHSYFWMYFVFFKERAAASEYVS